MKNLNNLLTLNTVDLKKAYNLCVSNPKINKDLQLFRHFFKANPLNNDIKIVEEKVKFINKYYSTCLRFYSNKINIHQLAQHILNITNLDDLIKTGDPSAVFAIADTGIINLFSFATKYCCLHNRYVYGQDDYSIYDSVMRTVIPLYTKKYASQTVLLKERDFEKCRVNKDYVKFNNIIGQFIKGLNLNITDPRHS